MNAIPYKGHEPYIFVSYAHRNRDIVFPVLNKMQEDGYRLWFDEGIDPGSEWDENIAQHINQCSFFLAFITKEYIESQNCKDELSYARDNNINRLIIYLENAELPDGLKMRVNRIQAIHWYRYEDLSSAYDKLYGAEGLAVCRSYPDGSGTGEKPPDEGKGEKPDDGDTGKKPPDRKILFLIGIVALFLIAGLIILLPRNLLTEKFHTDSGIKTTDPVNEPADSGTAPTMAPDEQAESPDGLLSVSVSAPAGTETPADGENSPGDVSVSIDMQHITLIAQEEMSVRDFFSSIEILKGRIEKFTDGLPYNMNVVADRIEMDLPADAFKGFDITYVLRAYLSRATDLYIFKNEQNKMVVSGDERILIDRNDIGSADLLFGAIPNVNAEDFGITANEYHYIRLVLKDEFADTNRDLLESWGNQISFGQDLTTTPWYYYKTFPAGDGKTFYLLNTDGEFFSGMSVYNLTHEPLARNFIFNVLVEPKWEIVENVQFPGENQCDPDELPRETIQVIFSTSADKLSPGEWIDTQMIFKTRLDALEVPYCFGTTHNPYEIAVRITPDRYSRRLMQLICSNNLRFDSWITAGLMRFPGSMPEIKTVLDENNNWSIILSPGDYYRDCMKVFENWAVTNEMPVILRFDKMPWFSGKADSETGTFLFDKIQFNGEERIGSDYTWIMKFLDSIITRDQTLPKSYQIASETYSVDTDPVDPLSYETEFLKIKEEILAAVPDADIRENGDAIQIFLDLPVNEELPEKAVNTARAIYSNISLADSPYNSVGIYLIHEDDSVQERGRIFYRKSYAFNSAGDFVSGDFEEGSFNASVIFQGGRLDDYHDEFISILQDDPFFSGLSEISIF